jgi:hypothetical protein
MSRLARRGRSPFPYLRLLTGGRAADGDARCQLTVLFQAVDGTDRQRDGRTPERQRWCD